MPDSVSNSKISKKKSKNSKSNLASKGKSKSIKSKSKTIKSKSKSAKSKTQNSIKINEDSQNVDLLRNFDTVLDNIWYGDKYKILIGLNYVLNRHKKHSCFVAGELDTPQKRINIEKFNIVYMISEKINKNKGDIIYKREGYNRTYKKNIVEYMTVPFNFNLSEKIKECIKNNKRFLVGLLFLYNQIKDKDDAHQNCYIYDIKKRELEIFEPFGGRVDNFVNLYNLYNVYSQLKSYFSIELEKINIDLNYTYKPINYCPVGPQRYNNMTQIVNSHGGYCAAWSLYYLDVRLSNPNVPRKKLIETILEDFKGETAIFINSYSSFILNNFLKNVLDIDNINSTYPKFIENFNNNKLTKKEQEYLKDKIIQENVMLFKSL